ncbi:hypothetical protein TNCV_1983401 [Trichonephila clavipes]|nr:hypothetical protein TNCV_1983401 [Trichonephila clavipes]
MQSDLRKLICEHIIHVLQHQKDVNQKQHISVKHDFVACSEETSVSPVITSRVVVPRNEAADDLASRGCDLFNPSSFVWKHSKIPSMHRGKMNLTWQNPPAHQWYATKSPGLFLLCRNPGLL